MRDSQPLNGPWRKVYHSSVPPSPPPSSKQALHQQRLAASQSDDVTVAAFMFVKLPPLPPCEELIFDITVMYMGSASILVEALILFSNITLD